jgi:hypothetical protein
METKQIVLGAFGIVITIDYDAEGRPIAGSIVSELQENEIDEDTQVYNVAMDAIESMVLAHAMAEIDVTSNGYIEGLDTAVNACANNL